MDSSVTVSVVIASFNGARHVGEAIDSVLAEPRVPVEVIVVDDGSTDDTSTVLARYGGRITSVRQKNAGPCVARNTGLRSARGDYVVFLDHDDRLVPGMLQRRTSILDARPEVGLVYCGWRFIDDAGRPLAPSGWPRREGDLFADVVLENPIHLAAGMVRRPLLDAIGGFDESRTGLEDWDLWLRLCRRGLTWACVDEALVEYRVHPGQRHTRGIERVLGNRIAILDELFADATLPRAVMALRAEAYQNAYLKAAADYFRAEARNQANDAFLAAVQARPELLIEPRTLRRFCRLLAPMGFQGLGTTVADWRNVSATLWSAVGDLVARPDLSPNVARFAWRARLTALAVIARLARKRALGFMSRAAGSAPRAPGSKG